MAEGTWYSKIALLVLLVAFLLYLIAFGAPHWAKANEVITVRKEHIGIWKYCTYPVSSGEFCNDFVDIIVGDWLKAAQGFLTLTLFTFFGAIGLTAMYAFVSEPDRDMRVFGATVGAIAFTGVLFIVGLITFASKCPEYFNNKEPGLWNGQVITVMDWAFYVAIVSIILTFGSMGCLIASLVANADDY